MKKVKKTKIFTLKGIALKLYNYFLKEKERDCYFYSLSKPLQRTVHVLGVKERTLYRWISNDSGDDKMDRRGRPVKLDDFDKDLVGRTIVKMMAENKYVTVRTLRCYLKKNADFDIKKDTLWRCVRSLGFCF